MAMIHKFGLNVTSYLTGFKTVRKPGVRLRYYPISVWSPVAAGIIDHQTALNSYTAPEHKCQNHQAERKQTNSTLRVELSWFKDQWWGFFFIWTTSLTVPSQGHGHA